MFFADVALQDIGTGRQVEYNCPVYKLLGQKDLLSVYQLQCQLAISWYSNSDHQCWSIANRSYAMVILKL